ncbi:MAG: ABC transporter substrate-binding protein [Anaerolineae bacterium]
MWRNVQGSLYAILVMVLLASTVGCGAQVTPAPTAPVSTEPTVAENPTAAQGTVYKLGYMVASTGSAASLGEPERDAALMLQEQLDAAGGITGPDGVVHPVELLIYDTEGSGDVAIPVMKKLIDDEGVVAILGPTTSPVAMAMIPIAMEAQIPMVSMASSSAIVEPVAERTWIFKTAQSNEHTAPWQVRYAKAKGLLKVANLYVNNAYGEDGAEAIRATAAAEGLEIVLEDTFDAADTDMTAQITKIKASDAQAVLVTAIPPAAAIFTKQYRELGLTMPLIHNHGVGMAAFIELCGEGNAEGVIFPMGKLVAADALPDDDPQKQVLLDFVRDFEASSGKPASTFAGHGWDAVALTLEGLKLLPEGLTLEEQRARLRDEIEGLQGIPGTGGVFNLSAEDHVGLSPDDVVLVRITDDAWEYFPPDKW